MSKPSKAYLEILARMDQIDKEFQERVDAYLKANPPAPGACEKCRLKPCHALCVSRLTDDLA